MLQVSWSADVLACAERPTASPISSTGGPHYVGLSWLPSGEALAVVDSLGTLAICDIKGDLLTKLHAGHSSKVLSSQMHALSSALMPV